MGEGKSVMRMDSELSDRCVERSIVCDWGEKGGERDGLESRDQLLDIERIQTKSSQRWRLAVVRSAESLVPGLVRRVDVKSGKVSEFG